MCRIRLPSFRKIYGKCMDYKFLVNFQALKVLDSHKKRRLGNKEGVGEAGDKKQRLERRRDI